MCESHEDDWEMLESTAHDGTKEWELRIESELFGKCLEKDDIDPRNGDHWEELIDRDDPEGDEDFFADMFGCPDFFQIGDHRMILRIWRILGKNEGKSNEKHNGSRKMTISPFSVKVAYKRPLLLYLYWDLVLFFLMKKYQETFYFLLLTISP